MLKMMKNMSMNKGEDKFKRVRIANANFNSKVGEVNGGIEVSECESYNLFLILSFYFFYFVLQLGGFK